LSLQYARSDYKKAELFAEHLQEVFTPQDNLPLQETDSVLNHTIQSSQQLKPFALKEILKAINTLNPKKATGYDLITTEILKQLPKKGCLKLLYLFNAILRLHYWPLPLKPHKS
jgi:hypothetical protein